jgi:hypothetical protein
VALSLEHLLLQQLGKLELESQQRAYASLELLHPQILGLRQKLLPFRFLLLSYFF